MQTHSFKHFITKTCNPDERYSARLMRFSLETGVSMPTLQKALRNVPVSRRIATKLSEATDGEILPEQFVFPAETKGDQ